MIRIQRSPEGHYVLEASIDVARPREEVFPFFADARNLQRLTPPWLDFEVRTPEPIPMQEGALIDYRLRLHGIPLAWRSRIERWDPPASFVDVQVRGPYSLWEHEHRFIALGPRSTRIEDRVRYAVPGGALVHRLFIRRDLERIFGHRLKILRELLPEAA